MSPTNWQRSDIDYQSMHCATAVRPCLAKPSNISFRSEITRWPVRWENCAKRAENSPKLLQVVSDWLASDSPGSVAIPAVYDSRSRQTGNPAMQVRATADQESVPGDSQLEWAAVAPL